MSLPLLLVLLVGACQPNTSEQDTNDTATDATTIAAVVTDSLTQVYQSQLEQLENKYPLQCLPERGKVNPADAAPQDTVFFVFREHLKRILADKDIFALLPFVSPDIKCGFGAENGLQSFIQMWELDSPEKISQSKLWATLSEVLSLGGQFHDYGQGAYFEAPYLGPCWPSEAEPYEYGAVIGAGVRLRSGPNTNTQILKNLSYDLVKYLETTPIETTIGGETHPWIKVELADGTQGFLYGKFYRSPLDFRAGFQQDEAGQWKLVRLLAGD